MNESSPLPEAAHTGRGAPGAAAAAGAGVDPGADAAPGIDASLAERALSRIRWRLLPFLGLLYIVSFLDRVNISFAKLTMDRALGISDAAYAFAAGVFFVGYFLFEVPSNLILAKVGARRWIARILITWGLVSAATAFVSGAGEFVAMRFLLGLAEAGFFPGILLYLTYWFPATERAKVVGLFMVAVPLASVIGSPISGALLGIGASHAIGASHGIVVPNGIGGRIALQGWQWLLVGEGLPAVALGLICLAFLPDTPGAARWLAPAQRAWLLAVLARERAAVARSGFVSWRAAIAHPDVWLLSLVYFCVVLGLYGLGFWLPTLIARFGVGLTHVGWIAALPPLCGTLFMVGWARRSDRRHERVGHLILPAILGFLGFVGAGHAHSLAAQIVCLCFASMGIYGALPVFWTFPSGFLSGAAVAAGIALINSLGNLAGYLGPQAVNWVTRNGDFGPALILLGLIMLLAGLLAAVVGARLQKSGR